MQSVDGVIQFSAADLIGHLSCRHLTKLDAAVARGQLEAPKSYDPFLEILWQRGAAHERAYRCGEFERLRHLVTASRGEIKIEKATPAGETPLKAIEGYDDYLEQVGQEARQLPRTV